MKENKKGCDLKSCVFCKLCLKEWLPAINLNRKTIDYKKGEVIFREGEKVEGIYFVYSGTVKVHKKWGEEKELILRFATKGDIFGHRGMGNNPYYPISATALENVTVCFIDLEFFITSLTVNHAYALQLMMFFADELQESEKNMRNLAHMSVKGRVASALLRLENKFGTTEAGNINIYMSRQDIASFSGTTYETVFRVLSDFEENGFVISNGKSITIKNVEELMKFTNQS